MATLQKQLDEVQDKIQDSLRLQHELTYSQQHLLQANSVLEQVPFIIIHAFPTFW